METEKIFEIIADVMHTEPGNILNQTRFTEDLGMDSLSMYEIMIRIEKEFDIEFDQDDADRLETAMDLADAVGRLYEGAGKNMKKAGIY